MTDPNRTTPGESLRFTDELTVPEPSYDREGAWDKIIKRGYLSDAGISQDGLYRYWLTRDWSQLSATGQVIGSYAESPTHTLARQVKLTFVMFNPSMADKETDDPTIRRCIGFARLWGYGGIQVVNLFALRSPDPEEIHTRVRSFLPSRNPTGAVHSDGQTNVNDRFIGNSVRHAAMLGFPKVVCAWGALARNHKHRAQHVITLIKGAGGVPHCLGTTKEGFPRHPLYVPNAQVMVPYAEA